MPLSKQSNTQTKKSNCSPWLAYTYVYIALSRRDIATEEYELVCEFRGRSINKKRALTRLKHFKSEYGKIYQKHEPEGDQKASFLIATTPRRALLLSLDCSTLPFIRTLYCWVLSKEISSSIFKVFGMCDLGLNQGLQESSKSGVANNSKQDN